MASRYWVGGTGNWNSTSHWSTSDGGGTGASVPTSTTDVFVTSNSGFGAGGTITENGTSVVCASFTSTSGHSYNIKYSTNDLTVYGNVTLESGVTFTSAETSYLVLHGSSSHTFTANGASLYGIDFDGTGAYTLGASFTASSYLYIKNGSVSAGSYNITASYFEFTSSATINMGSGTWEIKPTGGGDVIYINSSVVINAQTSTLKINHQDVDVYNVETYNGITWNNIWITGTTGATLNLYYGAVYNNFRINSPPRTVLFGGGTTHTVSSWTVNGTAGNLIIFDVTSGVSPFMLSSTTTLLSSTYLSLKNSTATGGALWYAGSGSTNVSNNTGWVFRDGFIPTGIANTPTFGTASFTTKITMDGFANENSLGVPRFYNGSGILPDTLINTVSFGTPSFTSTPAFTPTGITSTNAFGNFSITRIKASSTEFSRQTKNRTSFVNQNKSELAYSSVLKNKTNYDKQ